MKAEKYYGKPDGTQRELTHVIKPTLGLLLAQNRHGSFKREEILADNSGCPQSTGQDTLPKRSTAKNSLVNVVPQQRDCLILMATVIWLQ